MPETKSQKEFDYKIDERDWSAVRLLVEELEQELSERRNHLLFRIGHPPSHRMFAKLVLNGSGEKKQKTPAFAARAERAFRRAAKNVRAEHRAFKLPPGISP